MAHRDWCGKPCEECASPCPLDEAIPCSPDCEALNADGSRKTEVCSDSGCDAVDDKNSYPCSLHDTPRTFDWCEENCDRYYSCDTVACAGDEVSE